MKWTINNIQGLTDKTAIVTGANSGIGFETTKALAMKGATVIMACRNIKKATQAAEDIRKEVPAAKLELLQLDLADLASVGHFAEIFKTKYQQLDLLINNAGVMMPSPSKSKDGFEIHLAANHLGHFALTGLLLDVLMATPQARVVNISSTAHRQGKMAWDHLQMAKGFEAYSRSKLANLLFTYELQRRFKKVRANAIAVAAHPGWTKTNLQNHLSKLLAFLLHSIMQEMSIGALPILYAATVPDVQGSDFYGPDGFMEMRGYPKKVKSSDASYDLKNAQKLWEISEQLSGVYFDFSGPIQGKAKALQNHIPPTPN